MNFLTQLHAYGQSCWYDNVRRQLLLDGTIARLIAEDGIRGITSNPSIFEKAIAQSNDYDEEIQQLVAAGHETMAVYEALAIHDIQMACDLFAPLYHQSHYEDGYVSFEVSPYLANQTEETIAEAIRLFGAVNRPNLMIKVPATPAGIPAITELIGQGINVNVTLMFSEAHYRAVAQAYIDGVQKLIAKGGNPAQVASVASFFVSRVDTVIDGQLIALEHPELAGKAAIANCKKVYQIYKTLFHGEPFAACSAENAQPQRLLWASTSTKNPNYLDTIYVDELIAPETVNTMPPATVDAFRDHGTLGYTLEQGVAEAEATLAQLAQLGIDLDEVTESLQLAGVQQFAEAFDRLLAVLATKIAQLQLA